MILTNEQIQSVVSKYFAGKPVLKAWLFGSYARGEADEYSDVDVLVDIDQDAKVGIKYFTWHKELGTLLNKKVDVVSAGWENENIKPFIDKEKRIIYER